MAVTTGPRERLTRRDMQGPQPEIFSTRRQWIAGLISFGFHLTVLVSIATFWIGPPHGTGGDADRPVGIAIVYDAGGVEQYEVADSDSAPDASVAANENGSEGLLGALPNADQGSAETANLLKSLMPSTDGIGAAASSGGLGLGDGGGSLGNAKGGGKVKTSVFGIEGEGAKFVYVFDISDSMNGYYGRPLAAAKRELVGSLQTLNAEHEFQVIFYNDEPRPFAGSYKLFRADDKQKQSAINFVKDKSATGGTRHLPALKKALLLRPDVIFFLTDADDPPMKPSEIEEIQYMASFNNTSINAIQFGEGPSSGAKWIQSIASGTRGQFRYVDAAKFGELPARSKD